MRFRPYLRLHSIRQKLQVTVLIATFVALAFSLLGNIAGDIWAFNRDLVASTGAQAEQLGRIVAPALRERQAALAAGYLQSFLPNVLAVAVYDADGRLFASYRKADLAQRLPAVPVADERDHIDLRGKSLAVFRPWYSGEELQGTVYLRVDYDLTDTIVEDIEIGVVVGALALAIALLLISRLEQRVTRPIVAVADLAREVVARRDYTRRAEKTGDDEVGVLVGALNEMLDVIERRNSELLASYQDMTDEIKGRKLAQQEVMRLNDGLEQRVRERTAALQQSNRELAEAKASADHANQAKSSFLSSMSHELRTPLNSILGFAQLLASTDQPAELRAEFVGYIVDSGRHLLVLINEILNLAQIESGATTVALEAVALADLLDECRAMIAPLAEQRGVTLRVLSAAPPAVLADRTRLKQVLLNLLSNAVKYNRPGGSVTLDCSRTDGGRVQLAVSDTGVGMDDAQMQALFQPFNRLGQEGGAEEGTGIGLVVTQRLVGLMGGSLGASSVAGAGSVFWIELDGANLPAAARCLPRLDAPGAPAPATLLCIDEHPGHLKLLEELVRATPSLRLISAPDAVLGIQLARAELPALILMDPQLSGMSGRDALAILRSDPQTAAIPVIALCDAMPDADVNAGFSGQLAKPVDPLQFHAALRAALAAAPQPAATESA